MVTRVRLWLAAVCCGGLAAGLAACDAGPGPADYINRPPVLTNLFFNPTGFALSDIPANQIVDGRLRVSLFLSASARDQDGRVAEVGYVVQSPLANRAPLAQGLLTRVSEQQFETTASLEIPVGEVGVYAVVLYVVDEEGAFGNQIQGTLNFAATGRPPVITGIEAQPEVVRPPTELRLIVSVADPDGLSNIARVVGITPNGTTFTLLDDGRNFGDQVAGDGRYTARFDVPQATPGLQVFSFQAYDRTGLKSDVVTKPVTIE